MRDVHAVRVYDPVGDSSPGLFFSPGATPWHFNMMSAKRSLPTAIMTT
jgi:hypothetical protein